MKAIYPDYVRERFWAKVKKAGDDECWFWTGAVGSNGYGRFRARFGVVHAHRAAWEIANDQLLQPRFACHTCDNKLCVNPAHLYAGDHASNTRDAVSRGLMRSPGLAGTENPNAKLTNEQVTEIKRMIADGISNVAIARQFPVTHALVSRIRTGRSWAQHRFDEPVNDPQKESGSAENSTLPPV